MDDLAKADWTDPERVKSLIDSYDERYGELFWSGLTSLIGQTPRPTVLEFGCGPGLFLADSVKRLQASQVYGFDSSEEMLSQARDLLGKVLPIDKIHLARIDFDKEWPNPGHPGVDLAFSGYMLHEVNDPLGLLKAANPLIGDSGVSVVFDFISGDGDAFVRAMVKRGMTKKRALMRYPHVCKHSLDDLVGLFRNAGYQAVESVKIDGFRAIVVGRRAEEELLPRETVEHKQSPWAFEGSELVCPRCGSKNVTRIVDRWAMQRGVQVFQCSSCGRKFYDRGVDDYSPTY